MGHKSSCHSLFADVFFGTDRSLCLPETNICLCITTTTTLAYKLLGSSDDRTCGTVYLLNCCFSVQSCWIYAGFRWGWREYLKDNRDRTNALLYIPQTNLNVLQINYTANFSLPRLDIKFNLQTKSMRSDENSTSSAAAVFTFPNAKVKRKWQIEHVRLIVKLVQTRSMRFTTTDWDEMRKYRKEPSFSHRQ